MGLYVVHHNSRIPFESAKIVFDDEAMMSYPWGPIAYEVLVVSIKMLDPQGRTYTINGMKDTLLILAYEYVTCFRERFRRVVNNDDNSEDIPLLRWGGKRTRASFQRLFSEETREHGRVRVRNMVMKESVEEVFPQWLGEAEDLQLVKSFIGNNTHEKSLPQTVQQKSVNSPLATVYKTPTGKDLEAKNSLVEKITNANAKKDEADAKEVAAKKVAATPSKPDHLDFLSISPTKDVKVPKHRAYGRGCKVNPKQKDEDALTQKAEAVQKAEIALNKKKAAELKKKEAAELKKTNSRCYEKTCWVKEDSSIVDVTDDIIASHNELLPESDVELEEVVRSSRIKEYREKTVQLSTQGCSLVAVSSEPCFLYIGDNGTTCMRKNVEPSTAIYDPLAHVDPFKVEILMDYISKIPSQTVNITETN
ncbi:uncharacterized protein LOC108858280 [Raphanus sativus]|uniref:Uncharacterized protein LOC108858280 n=1 Tax=Raphanus sativus TaxID=3726 RepID=A0A6J0NST8_RAPSA|nr:uncharacterized protein LOC108858280 [Raphanus sativus]